MFESTLDLSDHEFAMLRDLMYKITGVQLRPSKKPLVVARLRKRLAELGLKGFADYIALVRQPGSPELEVFINAITTNETFFFRHETQLDTMRDAILPELVARKVQQGGPKSLQVWSAACSTGEEPYSLAIMLNEFFALKPGWNLKIFASDINSRVLRSAKQGIYDERSIRYVQPELKSRYFREVDGDMPLGRKEFSLSQNIRHMVEFRKHNLMERAFCRGNDIVFLRNVMIYFDKESKQHVVSMIQDSLAAGGIMVISLAETLHDVKSSMKFLKQGIYIKQ